MTGTESKVTNMRRRANRFSEMYDDSLHLDDLDGYEVLDDDLTDEDFDYDPFDDGRYADDDFTYRDAGDDFLYQDDFVYRSAASGLYGHTKATEKAVMSAINKVSKKAITLARSLEAKEPVAGTYLSTHANISKCSASMILSGQCMLNEMPKRAGTGHLGHNPRVAKRALTAAMDLRLFAGEVANDLHKRSVKRAYDFLAEHAEVEGCMASQLLAESFPPVASEEGMERKAFLMSDSSRYLKDLKRKALYSVSNMHLVPFSVMNAYDPVGARDNEVYISNADRKKYVVVSDGSLFGSRHLVPSSVLSERGKDARVLSELLELADVRPF